jgi:hypothetical protein
VTLEAQLADLADHLDVPAGDALATRVGARVRARRRRSARRRLVVVLGVAVVFVLAVPLAPAVGDWLGIDGVEVRQEPPPSEAGRGLDLGSPVTLAEAGRRAGFAPLVPPVLGTPDEVWLDTRPAVPIVWFVYADGPLLAQFRGGVPDEPVLRKFVTGAVTVDEVDVGGPRALWINGVHEVVVETPGAHHVDRLRLSDCVLLLELDDRVVRIETLAGRAAAVRIARNLVAVAGVEAP